MLQHTAECALAVTFLQLRKGTSEGGSPEVCSTLSFDCCRIVLLLYCGCTKTPGHFVSVNFTLNADLV